MPQSDFRFIIRIIPANPDHILTDLIERLTALESINSVSTEIDSSDVKLAVNVSFEDAASAKKLHPQVMKTIMNHDGVSITEITTMLTDIF